MARSEVVDDVIRKLLEEVPAGSEIQLDRVAEAIDVSFTHEDIERVIDALESSGREVVGLASTDLKQALGQVLRAARTLREAGLQPSIASLAERTGLAESQVRAALILAQVMSRGP